MATTFSPDDEFNLRPEDVARPEDGDILFRRFLEGENLKPADILRIEKEDRERAIDEAEQRATRLRNQREKAKSDEIVALRELVQDFISERILHELFFLVPDGHKKFEDLTKSFWYYIYHANLALLKNDPPPIEEGRRWVVLGGGTGRLEKELILHLGFQGSLDIRLIDLSSQSHSEFERNIKEANPNATVRVFRENLFDFTEGGMYFNNFWENNIRAPGDETPLYVSLLNVLWNSRPSTSIKTLEKMRPFYGPDDVIDTSVECTQLKTAIYQAYGIDGHYPDDPSSPPPPDLADWFIPGFIHLFGNRLGIRGLKPEFFRYMGTIRDGDEDDNDPPLVINGEEIKYLNFKGYVAPDDDHPELRLSKKLRNFLNSREGRDLKEPFMRTFAKFRKVAFEVVSSRRYPEVVPAEILRLCGYEIFKTLNLADLPQNLPPHWQGINPIIVRSRPRFERPQNILAQLPFL